MLTQEEIEAIRERVEKAKEYGEGVGQLALRDIPKLLAEIERLRGQLTELICAVYEYEPEGTALMDLAERIDEE